MFDRSRNPAAFRDVDIKPELAEPAAPLLSSRDNLKQLRLSAAEAEARALMGARHNGVLEKEVAPLLEEILKIVKGKEIPPSLFFKDLREYFEAANYK
jgi:hypothetical protein